MNFYIWLCISLIFPICIFVLVFFIGNVVNPYQCPKDTLYISYSKYCLTSDMTLVEKEYIGEDTYNISLVLTIISLVGIIIYFIWLLTFALCIDYKNKLFCKCCYKDNIEVKPNPRPNTNPRPRPENTIIIV